MKDILNRDKHVIMNVLNRPSLMVTNEETMGLGACDIRCIRVHFPRPGRYLTKV